MFSVQLLRKNGKLHFNTPRDEGPLCARTAKEYESTEMFQLPLLSPLRIGGLLQRVAKIGLNIESERESQ